jgi:hypothetical protein
MWETSKNSDWLALPNLVKNGLNAQFNHIKQLKVEAFAEVVDATDFSSSNGKFFKLTSFYDVPSLELVAITDETTLDEGEIGYPYALDEVYTGNWWPDRDGFKGKHLETYREAIDDVLHELIDGAFPNPKALEPFELVEDEEFDAWRCVMREHLDNLLIQVYMSDF